jgi:hypothetical protein
MGDWSHIYDNNTVVGTVSQSGGLPTGAVIERGSTADGDYLRFADGTQICWQTETLSVTTAATGAIFTDTKLPDWTFPMAFSAPPAVTVSAEDADAGIWGGPGGAATALLTPRQILSATALSGRSVSVVSQATGRWF